MTAGEDGAHADRPPRGDAAMEAIAALRRVASSGSAALGGLLAHPEVAQALASLAGRLGEDRAAPGGGERRGGPGAEDAARALGFIGQAYLIAATSGLRYWGRVAETCGEHQLDFIRAMGGGEPPAEVLDGLQAYARKLGDVSLQEARLFQAELDRLAIAFAAPGDPSAPSDEHRRRWRVKP